MVCGRMVQAAIKKLWASQGEMAELPPVFQPRYNLAPTSAVLVVRAGMDGWSADMMRWGLVPSWWKDATKLPSLTFNARAETIATKPTFRSAFKRRRCIVPADGFYEWKATGGKVKQAFYIHSRDPEKVFAFAGVWELWETADGAMESCTIITTEPNALMAEIHTRMPVILSPHTFEEWLDPTNEDTASLQRFLVPCDPAVMDAYSVGLVKGDGRGLIVPTG